MLYIYYIDDVPYVLNITKKELIELLNNEIEILYKILENPEKYGFRLKELWHND